MYLFYFVKNIYSYPYEYIFNTTTTTTTTTYNNNNNNIIVIIISDSKVVKETYLFI